MTITWDASFVATPDDETGLQYLTGEYIQQTREALAERLSVEHNFNTSEAAPQANHGMHKAGTAIAYRQSTAPTLRPDGVTALSDDDIGRIWIDTSGSVDLINIYTGVSGGWEVLAEIPMLRVTGGVATLYASPDDRSDFYDALIGFIGDELDADIWYLVTGGGYLKATIDSTVYECHVEFTACKYNTTADRFELKSQLWYNSSKFAIDTLYFTSTDTTDVWLANVLFGPKIDIDD